MTDRGRAGDAWCVWVCGWVGGCGWGQEFVAAVPQRGLMQVWT